MDNITKANIDGELNTWMHRMVEKYHWLSISYEFSDKDNCFLVSYGGDKLYDETFSKDALDFEKSMDAEYEDDAPLFTDNEELFELTENKLIINYESRRN